ncbi:MAG: M28 family peptidase [Bacteroidetes bacterium]|nr:M28 family peptidase [Bacteroidota bacterium]
MIFFTIALLLSFLNIASAQTEFSKQHAEQILKVLSVDIGPRPMGSPAEQRALKFAVDKFKSFGCDTAYIMPMTFTAKVNTNSGVAVGIKKGAAKRIIVIGGHIDSAGPEIPGADDNGSGSAVVLELSRIIAKREMQSTVVFALFGGEEQGLQGSTYFADFFPDIDSVALMLQVDMANGLGILEIDPHTYTQSAPKWLVKAAIEEYNKLGYTNLSYPVHAFTLNYATPMGVGSDHQPFLDRGIPSIAFITDITKPIHTPQDNYKNFDLRGLKRSGDLVLKLVERFDKGIPDRTTDKYWLYVIGSFTPISSGFTIFLPKWILTAFILVSIILSVVTFIDVRRRRLVVTQSPIINSSTDLPIPNPRRFSGIKLFLFTIPPVTLAWFASDLLCLLKGIRYPWFTDFGLYLLLSAMFGFLGLLMSFRFEKKIRLSKCPYYFYKRSAILLLIYTIPLSFLNTSIAIYPAAGLFFVSLALLIRVRFLKIILFLIAPFPMFRIVFNEWTLFSVRSYAMARFQLSDSAVTASVNFIPILLLIFLVLPFFYAFAAVYRDTPTFKPIMEKLKTGKIFVVTITAIGILSFHLYHRPVYNEEWFRTVQVNQTFDVNTKEFNINLKSFEYLDSVKIKHSKRDTLLLGKILTAHIEPLATLDTTRWKIAREVKKKYSNDTTYFDVNLQLFSKQRPYKIEIYYDDEERLIRSFETDWKFTAMKGKINLSWYSFPEMHLKVLLRFYTIRDDTVSERIKVTYADLIYPMEFEREKTNFIKRTVVNEDYKYISRLLHTTYY